MSGIDFTKFQKTQSLIKECNMENKADHIVWLQFRKEETALMLAEMHQMCKAGLSKSIPLRSRSKNAANYYQDAVSKGLHVFAKEQARAELGLTADDVDYLFRHKGLFSSGGSSHANYVQMDLEGSEV